MRRIVVTGIGVVSPLGQGAPTVWRRLIEGRSGIRALPETMVQDLPAKIAGVVPDAAEDAEGGFDAARAVPPGRT